MSLFKKIQASLNSLSDAKKNVAIYILENWVEVSFLPASKVSKNANVSESVVVRFSQDLGFSGFPELQRELQKVLKSRLVNPKVSLNKGNNSFSNTNKDITDIYNKSIKNLDEVYKNNSIETFTNFANRISKASKILILARQNSFGPAHLLNVHLNEISAKSVVMNGESVEALDYIRGLTSEDLVIFISIPSYSKRMNYYSDYLKQRKLKQIAITNSRKHKIGQNADILLLTSVNSLSFSNSHLGTIFILDIILYLLTQKNKGELLKHLEEIKVLNERFEITE